MTRFQSFLAPIFAAAMAATAAVHAQPSAPASAAIAESATAKDCAAAKAKHDHGAERGTPSARPMAAAGCPAAGTSAVADVASAPKKRLNHDHSKFHKNS